MREPERASDSDDVPGVERMRVSLPITSIVLAVLLIAPSISRTYVRERKRIVQMEIDIEIEIGRQKKREGGEDSKVSPVIQLTADWLD